MYWQEIQLFLGEIGIEDLNQVDYGDTTAVDDDEVPVFWCCGVTALEAIKEAKPDLAFTHSPGCMYVSDLKQEKTNKDPNPSKVRFRLAIQVLKAVKYW